MAGFPAFAHLGRNKVAPVRAAEEESDEDKKKREDEEKKAKAEDDDEKAKKAEEDDEKKKDDDEKAKKAKKAKADEDKKKEDEEKAQAAALLGNDDAGDRDDMRNPVASAARLRERGRVRAILLSDIGKAHPTAAAHVATGISLPRSEAIEMLSAMIAEQAAPAPTNTRSDALRNRMQSVDIPAVGSGDVSRGSLSGTEATAAAIINAGKKRRGEI